jgi:ribosome biogenesis protein YTM1
VHVFSVPSLEPDIAASENNTAKELYTLMGHAGPISSIAASRNGRELVSASWDGALNLYSIPDEVPTEHQVAAEPVSYLPGQKKRRKMNEERGPIEGFNDGDVGNGGWRRTPEGVMRGHKGRIGGVTWDKSDEGRVWTAGWDGSVRGWDVETGAGAVVRVSRHRHLPWSSANIPQQGPSDKSALCIDQWSVNGTLATGSMDRTVCLWDTREGTLWMEILVLSQI